METEGGSRDIVRCFGATRPVDLAEEQRQQWRAEYLAIPGTGHIHFTALPSEDSVADQLARRVKFADLADNCDPERLAVLRAADPHTAERLQVKYAHATSELRRLSDASGGNSAG